VTSLDVINKNSSQITWADVQIAGAVLNAFFFGCISMQLFIINLLPGMAPLSLLPFFFLTAAIAFAIAAKCRRQDQLKQKTLVHEHLILKYAKSQNERALTISEISLNCSLLCTDSLAVLNKLSTIGACRSQLSDDGELLYRFSGLKQIGTRAILCAPILFPPS